MYVLVRIFVGESEELEGQPLYYKLAESLREKGVRGATLLRAVLGYGTMGEFHYEGVEALSYDLPVVIEFVEEENKAEAVIEELEDMLRGRLVSLERVNLCRL